jgi:hypothetical protein
MKWMKKPYDTLTSLIFTQKSKLMEAKQMKTATIELNLRSNFVLKTATSVNINFLLFNFKMIIKDKSSEIGSASRSPAYRYRLLLAGFDDYALILWFLIEVHLSICVDFWLDVEYFYNIGDEPRELLVLLDLGLVILQGLIHLLCIVGQLARLQLV